MSVRVADEVFILPLNAVMESLQPREADLHPLAGGERVLEVRGEYLPIVELWKVFNVAGAKTEATQGIILMTESRAKELGLVPLGYLRSYAFTAIDVWQDMLLGPAWSTPLALERAGLTMSDRSIIDAGRRSVSHCL